MYVYECLGVEGAEENGELQKKLQQEMSVEGVLESVQGPSHSNKLGSKDKLSTLIEFRDFSSEAQASAGT